MMGKEKPVSVESRNIYQRMKPQKRRKVVEEYRHEQFVSLMSASKAAGISYKTALKYKQEGKLDSFMRFPDQFDDGRSTIRYSRGVVTALEKLKKEYLAEGVLKRRKTMYKKKLARRKKEKEEKEREELGE